MKKVLLSLMIVTCAMAQTGATKAPASKSAATKAPAPAAAKPSLLNPASLNAKAPETFKVKMTTTKGDVIIQVTRAWAPHGADRFYNLAKNGFFTDAAFFRVIPGFMAQFGIPAKPEIARVWANANIIDDPVVKSNTRGMVTFAQTQMRNSRSMQFFINYGDNSRLDADRFAPFGEVLEGMDVMDKINAEYREQPQQDRVTNEGKAYLDRYFPKLDRILSMTVMPAAAAPAGDAKK
jgi:peptidyl-prolyl cis-trans isomerase A (cyclophilin A)